MTPEQIKLTIDVLENGFRETRRAYYAGVDGVTYDHMYSSAARLLEWRGRYEHATDRKVVSKATKAAIVSLLRNGAR